ncbi:MAG: cell division protein FtsA [Candidatus Paceibacterota bacterium]|jgi:cell division protein FtsA
MATIITSLDIGSSQVKGVVATPKKDGTLSVVTAFKQPSQGFKRGVLTDVEDASQCLRSITQDLERISKSATKNVFLNFSSEQVWSRMSRGIVAVARADQEIQQDDIDRVVQASRAVKLANNKLVLHNVVREFFVDDVGDIADPLGMTGNRLEVSTLIVEAFAPHVNALLKNAERAGLTVGGVIFNPLASARASLSKRQKDLGVLLVDFGFGTTTIAVYEEGKVLHTRCIPIGMGYVTNDIAIGFTTSIAIAEKLKTGYGYAIARTIPKKETINLSDLDPSAHGDISKRFLCEIIEARLEQIIDVISKDLVTLGRTVQLPGGVVLTGGGVKLPGITEYMREKLHLPIQVGFPDLTPFEITTPTYHDLLDDPEFSSALGLLLWGMSEEKKEVWGSKFSDRAMSFMKNLIP